MNFLQRIKTDKKFRFKAILVFIALVLVVGNVPGDKKEAKTYEQCHSIIGDGTFVSKADYNVCEGTPGCYVTLRGTSGNWPLGTDTLVECFTKFFLSQSTFIDDCTNEASDGAHVVATSANQGCSSGVSVKTGTVCGDDVYRCVPAEQGTNCNGDVERGIADLANSFMPSQPCQTRFYAVAFGGGFLALVVLLAAI